MAKTETNTQKQHKVPYYRKPEDLTVEEWQAALRKQFAAEQDFEIENTGSHPVFSDFQVYNPKSEKTYKVSIRDNQHSHNFCSCPDFRVNGLGTCKHIENVLLTLKEATTVDPDFRVYPDVYEYIQ